MLPTWKSLGADLLSCVTILEACSRETPSTVMCVGSRIVTLPALPSITQQLPRLLSPEMTDPTGPML